MPKTDLVLEGGGVKGVGLVGAVDQLMRSGYTVERVAGTSAGSIVGAFLAAGLNADQLTEVMDGLQYERVPDLGAARGAAGERGSLAAAQWRGLRG